VLADLIETLAAWAEHSVEALGTPSIVLLAFLENLFPPTPSEFLYPLAGKLAFDGALTVWGVVAAGVAGSLIGSLTYYTLGYRLGGERARAAIGRYGRIKLGRFGLQILSVAEYDAAVALFARRGGVIVVAARLIPLVHSVISIPAGALHMRLAPFILYTVIGSALWIAPLTILGWWMGSQWERILTWLDVYSYVWYAVMALAVVWIVARRVRRARSEDSS